MTPQFPVISLEALNRHDKVALDNLTSAASTWGFFRLVDHGIPAAIEQQLMAMTNRFFELSPAEKRQYLRTEQNPWGYFDQELTKNRRDWKEIFDLGIDQENEQYESQTPWPAEPAGFKDVMLDWFDRSEKISLDLIAAICESLDQPRSSLKRYFTPTSSSFLRLNHYPVCDLPADSADDFPDTGHLGIYHHTDAGAVTVLLQDQVEGLQVKLDGQWLTVPVVPGSLVINIGDLVQVWSNDRYQAPLHRVLANSKDERYSAAFFMNPIFSTECAPLGDVTPKYTPVNWGEFRAARAAGDYSNIGAESQITDYAVTNDAITD